MEKQKHFIKIEPYVYTAITSNSFLLYNTLNGKLIESNDERLLKLIKLGNITFSTQQKKQPYIVDFINLLEEYFIGEIIELNEGLKLPAKIIFNIEKSIDSIDENNLVESFSSDKYITEITIHLNNSNNDFGVFEDAYKQFAFPIGGAKSYSEVHFDYLINFLRGCLNFILISPDLQVGEMKTTESWALAQNTCAHNLG